MAWILSTLFMDTVVLMKFRIIKEDFRSVVNIMMILIFVLTAIMKLKSVTHSIIIIISGTYILRINVYNKAIAYLKVMQI